MGKTYNNHRSINRNILYLLDLYLFIITVYIAACLNLGYQNIIDLTMINTDGDDYDAVIKSGISKGLSPKDLISFNLHHQNIIV